MKSNNKKIVMFKRISKSIENVFRDNAGLDMSYDEF